MTVPDDDDGGAHTRGGSVGNNFKAARCAGTGLESCLTAPATRGMFCAIALALSASAADEYAWHWHIIFQSDLASGRAGPPKYMPVAEKPSVSQPVEARIEGSLHTVPQSTSVLGANT